MKITSSIQFPQHKKPKTLERGDIVESRVTNNVYVVTGVSEPNGTFSGILLYTETTTPLGTYSDALVTNHVQFFEGELTLSVEL